MIKYLAVSTASKAFSLNSATRGAYRKLGNVALQRMRVSGGLNQAYIDRAVRLIDYCDRYDVLAPGEQVLELGTGWVHWEATVLRLFHDVDVTLYDVCDNRLFGAYRTWLGQFRDTLDTAFAHLSPDRVHRARQVATDALRAGSFAELYATLGFTYVLDPTGRLEGVDRGRYALAVSADVLEHVQADTLPTYLDTVRQCLVPGGASIHQIDLVDHFSYFDPTCSPKHYYRYTDRAWRRWFESDVQYFNRVQRPEWMELFAGAGFDLVDEEHVSQPLLPLPLSAEYACLDRADLDCMQLLTVHRNPGP